MTTTDIEEIARRAQEAHARYSRTAPAPRAHALAAVAAALAADAEVVALAQEETGLTEARLIGEVTRTAYQLRMFADVIRAGDYLDVRIDAADPGFPLGPRPDLRRCLLPAGPVLNFAASNFPFAFSVIGGDTASALAAGCAVVVKAHPGHPRLSDRCASLAADAMRAAGMPTDTLQLVHGFDEGVELLRHPAIKVATFTGSVRGGRALADIAAARPAPIPFFGELGSVNPVVVTAAALRERADEIVSGYVASVSGSAGQLCTKPGFLFVPSGHGLADALRAAAQQIAEHRLLNPAVSQGYQRRRSEVLGAGADVIADGSVRVDANENAWATPTLVRVALSELLAHRDALLEESFGPLSIVVEYDDLAALLPRLPDLFPGNLTATVHCASGEEADPQVAALVRLFAEHAGRVLIGGWPTGVAVTAAMQHGGPWPATTNDSGTSVGSAAITRLLRPVAFQSTPQELLPEPLRDDNPWGVPQRRA
ncbi:aldehyde dehydrogenase (NADP(+)) [Flexivirga caeni]|uniref:Aldehyde dehydrogenase (NADP(+)) n=1 Tax=Flexivirga caeni TaxID=2294115 RepID=A0A3M9M0B9_9MICO|nr:aldehyde dehydrogenase (NADP(+)) [Flexivirga caeni]RNI19000.1 aldehyde dehydrogenase (NADP(+)) [Flexivirga caeni]